MQRILGSCKILTRFGCYRLHHTGKTESLFSLTRKQPSLRNYMTRTSANFENTLKEKDMIPSHFSLIYRGQMDNYMIMAHLGSLLIFIFGVMGVKEILTADKPISFPLVTTFKGVIGIQNYGQLAVTYIIIFAMIFCLRSVGTKYVLRMYYDANTQTYRAVRHGILPFATRTHDFKARTLKRIEKRHVVPWWNMQYDCNGQQLLIFDNGFRTNADYDRMFVDGDYAKNM